MAHSIRVEHIFPVSPSRLYEAWLDAAEHSAFTGSAATVEPVVGGRHTAWDGYIQGTIVDLVPGARIVKTWRTTAFAPDAPDSRVEVLFEAADGGTRLVLLHTEVPEGQPDYEVGWKDFYFQPMAEYFLDEVNEAPVAEPPSQAAMPNAATVKKSAAKEPAKKAAAKKGAAKKPVKKAAAKKPVKKGAAKKPVKKAAAKKPVKKAAVKKPVKKAADKKGAAKKKTGAGKRR